MTSSDTLRSAPWAGCGEWLSLTIAHTGNLASRGAAFDIYDLQYVTRPIPGGTPHGGRRILVLGDKGRYLGQYGFELGPRMWIGAGEIRTNLPPDVGNAIRFTDGKPPATAWLDGEIHRFGP